MANYQKKKASPEEIAKRIDGVWEASCEQLYQSFIDDKSTTNHAPNQIPQIHIPINPSTGKHFHGINRKLLANASKNEIDSKGSTQWDNRYLGFAQAKAMGLKMKKGSKGIPVLVYQTHKEAKETDPKSGKEQKSLVKLARPYRSYHTVFAMNCFENAPPMPSLDLFLKKQSPFSEINNLEKFIENTAKALNVTLKTSIADKAFYSAENSEVHLPNKDLFENPLSYYTVACHELGHASNILPELYRGETGKTPATYAKEELVAEFTAHNIMQKLHIQAPTKLDSQYLKLYISQCDNPKEDLINALFTSEKISNRLIELSGMQPEIKIYNELVEDIQKTHFELACENILSANKKEIEIKDNVSISL
ncbi:DUF1738 domain-containing protein [Vibrio anguillarum]|uniref:DUF1738 domain-containing protein n=1 Tax=Vibrio anguillarum TaxID=55601 RepID=A0A7U6J3N1_VIBAN|nr:zincin-like metallopeptidase domain-containing protein [Vibrio anguillarum]AZS26298.1 DUF1738 domain-containing protein [Vibrio anguillarum]